MTVFLGGGVTARIATCRRAPILKNSAPLEFAVLFATENLEGSLRPITPGVSRSDP